MNEFAAQIARLTAAALTVDHYSDGGIAFRRQRMWIDVLPSGTVYVCTWDAFGNETSTDTTFALSDLDGLAAEFVAVP